MKTTYVMIAHYTYGWTQRCLRSFGDHLPDKKMVVFNNNPRRNQIVQKTRGSRGVNATWNELCEIETQFIKQYGTLLDIPGKETEDVIYQLPTHGYVLDYIFQWANTEGYEYLFHLEPDCKICGTTWHVRMLEAINGKAVVGLGPVSRRGPYTMCICPTLWNVQSVLQLGISFNKAKPDINTGQKVLREFEKLGQLSSVQASDFVHYGGGTKRCPFMML